MLTHIVMMRIKTHLSKSEKQTALDKLVQLLEKLPLSIPEVEFLEIGLNVSTKDRAYDLVLTSKFADQAALQRYIEHPDHQKVFEHISAVVGEVALVDYLA